MGETRTKDTADVVVIGAGIQGLSVAYHLTKFGIKKVIVVEKDIIGSGSSGRSASMLMLQRENEDKIKLSQYSYQKYMEFKDELDCDPGFYKIGFLSVVPKSKKDSALKQAIIRQKLGVRTEILSPQEIKKIVPVLNTEDIEFGVFGPDDGVIDPHSIMMGYADWARKSGAVIEQGTEAKGIKIKKNEIIGVETNNRFISTSVVVNAAGADAIEVGQWAGIKIPISNRKRSIFITDEYPHISKYSPLVEDAEKEWYFRKEGPGVLMGMGKEEPDAVSMTPDWDFLSEVVEFAIHRVPSLRNVSIVRGWSGIRSLTPDINPILGPVEQIDGFINCCGWGGEGVMHAPAGGLIVAEYIVNSESKSFDISPFLNSRFIH